MIDAFWQWFVKINARTVFCATLLLLTGGLYLVSGDSAGTFAAGPSTVGRLAAETPSEAFTNRPALAPRTALPPGGPFASRLLTAMVKHEEEERVRAIEEKKRKEREEAERVAREKAAEEEARLAKAKAEVERRAAEEAAAAKAKAAQAQQAAAAVAAAAAAAPPPPVAPAAAPPPPPPPPPKQIKLVYRGYMTRTDGRTVAFVENVSQGEIVLMQRGEKIENMQIDRFSKEELSLIQTNNAVHVLKAGQLTTITAPP
jgi:hypothetical protein